MDIFESEQYEKLAIQNKAKFEQKTCYVSPSKWTKKNPPSNQIFVIEKVTTFLSGLVWVCLKDHYEYGWIEMDRITIKK